MIKRKEDKEIIRTALVFLAEEAVENNTDNISVSFDIGNKLVVSCDIEFNFDLKEEETVDD